MTNARLSQQLTSKILPFIDLVVLELCLHFEWALAGSADGSDARVVACTIRNW